MLKICTSKSMLIIFQPKNSFHWKFISVYASYSSKDFCEGEREEIYSQFYFAQKL